MSVRRFLGLLGMGMTMGLLAGCATGRNYQGDIDALNARINTLQGQLSEKDAEITRLQGQMGRQEAALSQAEADKRRLSDKLDTTLAELRAKESRASRTSDSDLK